MLVMKRKIACLLLVLLLMSELCLAAEPERKVLTHVVLAWLKPEFRTEEFIEKLLEANETLRNIPQVQSFQYGQAIKSDRKIVDDSFDFANVMTFNSEKDMQDYLAHPIHVEFIENYIKGKAEKIIAYDF